MIHLCMGHLRIKMSGTVDSGSDEELQFLREDFDESNIPVRTFDSLLVWKYGAGSSIRSVYIGGSRKTLMKSE